MAVYPLPVSAMGITYGIGLLYHPSVRTPMPRGHEAILRLLAVGSHAQQVLCGHSLPPPVPDYGDIGQKHGQRLRQMMAPLYPAPAS